MSPDGADAGQATESKVDQSSTTPGHQSVGLLAGTARLMKLAVTSTADRYKQFIDTDIDTETAPITSSDCDADGHSDESNDADESKLSPETRPDFQYTKLDDPGHHSMKLSLHSVCTPSTATTTLTTAAHQPAFHSRKVTADHGHDKCAVRQRPAKPDVSAHPSTANPFSFCKVVPASSYDSSAATNTQSVCSEKVDVFGAAPFHRKGSGPVESKADSLDNRGEIDVFANVPFVRQQERVAKAASSVSPPATLSKVAYMPNPALGCDSSSFNAFSSSESYSISNSYAASSAIFHQGSSGPMSASFVLAEGFSGGGQMNVASTQSSAVQLHGSEMQEMNTYAQQDSGPLLASPPLSVAIKGPHTTSMWSGTVSSECSDSLSCGPKTSSFIPVLPSDAGQSLHEEHQSTEESFTTGSLKRGWLAKLCSEKESPTTAVANLGFSDDPDAIVPPSAIPSASDPSFHENVLDATSEPRSPAMASELNFLLPSGAGSHVLPKVGVKKHLSHQHRIPPMPPETDSFSITKKGIALL